MNVLTLLVGLLLIAVTLFYGRGWVRLHRRGVPFANLPRLVVFLFAMTLTAIVFLSPLNWLNQEYLFVRVAQHVFLCLFAVPAFFISCTFDIAVWGLPKSARRAISRWVHSRGLLRRAVHGATQSWVVIMLFIALFVSWYDARIASWLLARPLAHTASLLLLGAAAMLVWWRLIGTGPRLHTELSPWLAAFALLFIELASMSTAVPIAFSTDPIYAHYVAAFAQPGRLLPLTIADDQALGGGLLWVGGSAVFLSSIVLILNRLFDRHGMNGSDPLPGWDDDDRMIMPGLEHRVKK
ncbi:cytochrome c oxidase assembly protein [Caldilinea sp.]|uniref:cytochrome c oxidase assembly protein n=1 Tax=Caldilinea sp. TaxID=2293560 RepID=UPI002BC1F213|nr:cytochrome c oxidase assembly protein [Caldilinea sp.]HRA68631.1 cytochrome c oxidase assembly protein [Caldilinea sp.]